MKKLMFRTLVVILVLQVLFFGSPSAVRAHDMICPPPTSVTIDIKPADYPNNINLSAKGLLPVAVLTTQEPDFDASQFTPHMAHLTDITTTGCVGAEATRWKFDDVDGDGQLDLVFFFRIQDLTLTPNSTEAKLMAHGHDGSGEIHIEGTDSVVVKP